VWLEPQVSVQIFSHRRDQVTRFVAKLRYAGWKYAMLEHVKPQFSIGRAMDA
jgi:hypothetical protein